MQYIRQSTKNNHEEKEKWFGTILKNGEMSGDLGHSQNDELIFVSVTKFIKIRVKASGKGVVL